MENVFHSTTHGDLQLEDVAICIKAYIEDDPKAGYSLLIGTDSHGTISSSQISLVTAVLIYKKGLGGKYFWQRKKINNIHTLRQKIHAETLISLEFASIFVPMLKQKMNGKALKYNLEIHVDVGEHGATRDMIKEVVGLVTGYGYVAKTKPESFAATYVADKHT